MIKKSLLFVFAILFHVLVFADNIDSLYQLVNTKYSDKPQEAVKILDQIYQKTYQTNPMYAAQAAAQAIILSDSILQNKELAATWKTNLALVYLNLGKLDLATKYLSEVRDYYRKNKEDVKFAKILMYLGDVYYKLEVYQIALDQYNKAEKIFSEYKDWDNLAIDRSKKALTFYDDYKYDKAYQLIYNTLDSFDLSLMTRAKLYSILGNLYKSDDNFDSAKVFYQKAKKIYKQFNVTFDYSQILLSIGQVFLAQNLVDSSLAYFNQALKLFTSLDAKEKIAETLNGIGLAYYKSNDYKNATKYFLKALQEARLAQSSKIIQNSYYYLGLINENQKNLEKALHYYKLYIDERNRYFDELTSRSYAGIIIMFQNEEKQREIEILKKEDALRTQQLRYLLVVVAILLLLVGAIMFMMNKLRVAKKLLEEQYKQIKLQKRELESQSRILEKATNNLLKQKEKIEKQNRDISASIKYASRIQKAMLPKPEMFAKYFDDFFIYYKPKETVSGDFYWLTEVTSEKPSLFQEETSRKVILVVADCTGHGVPGAFMAMLGDAYLNQIIKVQRIYKPDQILDELNKNIRQTLHHGDMESTDGMDIGVCVIDKTERTLDFAGAKLDLIYVQNGKMIRVHGDMYSIGGLKQEHEKKFTSKRIDITTETIFYMYSDGFQDQFGGKYGRKYMAKNFREFLFKIHTLTPMEKQRQALDKELKRWKGKKYQQMDDITVVGVKLKGKVV